MKINYILTYSHIDPRNGGYKVNVEVYVDKDDAIEKILEIHLYLCEARKFEYSYSDKFIANEQLNKNPTYIECKKCKFINDKINKIDITRALDGESYSGVDPDDNTYESVL